MIIRFIMKGQEDQFLQAYQANVEVEQRANLEREEREHLSSTIDRYVEYLGKVALGDLSARVALDQEQEK